MARLMVIFMARLLVSFIHIIIIAFFYVFIFGVTHGVLLPCGTSPCLDV
jgi:hypothetical protein